ncbi:MAG: hypothetical protein EOP06_20280 [Proteobacteria bacterium]|nr:MAG: hypothetical protein EOP06_20280 [Pseudomonadota bacterium]
MKKLRRGASAHLAFEGGDVTLKGMKFSKRLAPSALLLVVGFLGLLLVGSPRALAIPAPLTVKPNAVSMPLKNAGNIQGGRTSDEFSLLGVQSAKTANGEKLVLNYGDRFGKPVKGEPGYFQVALDKSGQRIVIDLAQVTSTGIEPEQLRKILATSRYVASSDMTMDPHDRSTNITLTLKEPVEMTVATDAGNRAKVVVEMKPVSSLRRKATQ